MDKILEKHLANALLIAKSNLDIYTPNDNIIPYISCVLKEKNCVIDTETERFKSKILGYWKDKPIISYNKTKYAILENSSTIVKLENLNVTEDKIQKTPELNKTSVKKKVIQPKAQEDQETELDPTTIAAQLNELLPQKETSTNSVISSYLEKLKKNDNTKENTPEPENSTENYVQSSSPKTFEDEFFSIFENKKDDPRFKRLFSYYSDQTKKEVHEINEKYSKQYMAKILETSGGGGTSNNSPDYSKGGIIDGDLTITSNLSVVGNVYSSLQIDNKRVFTIGNNTDTDYILDHNFNTKDLVITIYDSNDEMVLAAVKNINLNQTLISLSNPPANNIKVVIIR
jgi:hypothetical protein